MLGVIISCIASATVLLIWALLIMACVFPILWMAKKLFIAPITIWNAEDKDLVEARAFALKYAKQRKEQSDWRKALAEKDMNAKEVRAFWAL